MSGAHAVHVFSLGLRIVENRDRKVCLFPVLLSVEK